jgi:hypothetical protein
MKNFIRNAARTDRVSALTSAISALAVVAFVAAAFTSSAVAHRDGRWVYPTTVQRAIDRSPLITTCKGVGRARATRSSNANPATWLFQHFRCDLWDLQAAANQTFAGTICVHTLRNGRLAWSRIQGYRCRF